MHGLLQAGDYYLPPISARLDALTFSAPFNSGVLSCNKTVQFDFAGYKFDEHDRDSAILRLQFARFPGPRSVGGPRGKR